LTTSPLEILYHRLGSEPPTGFEDGDFIPIDASFNIIFGSPVMFPFDGVFSHLKPMHGEALPHHCNLASTTPLLQFAGVLFSSGSSGSSFRDFVVFGFFLKALDVTLLL
jgi:hypothetical protein